MKKNYVTHYYVLMQFTFEIYNGKNILIYLLLAQKEKNTNFINMDTYCLEFKKVVLIKRSYITKLVRENFDLNNRPKWYVFV